MIAFYVILGIAAWISIGIPIVSTLFVMDSKRSWFISREIKPLWLIFCSMFWPSHAVILLLFGIAYSTSRISNYLFHSGTLLSKYTDWLNHKRKKNLRW